MKYIVWWIILVYPSAEAIIDKDEFDVVEQTEYSIKSEQKEFSSVKDAARFYNKLQKQTRKKSRPLNEKIVCMRLDSTKIQPIYFKPIE